MRIAPLLFAGIPLLAGPPAAADDRREPEARDVSALLGPIVAKGAVPGMAGCVVEGGRVVALGAAGVREAGKEEKVRATDRFHLGSCTKAMTATLCGMLVEEGKLSWDRTLGKAFPDVRMDPKWKGVTLEQLLVQRSGAPADLSADGLWGRLWRRRGTPAEQRRELVEGVLAKPPLHEPGTKFLYANANFALAGAMAEAAAGKPWEDLLRERLFRPLGIESAGFGAPGSRDAVDEPRGHTGAGAPVPPGPDADNPPAIGPAGTAHMSLPDWARFVALHLEGEGPKARLLRPETFAKLHAAPGGDGDRYAMGWMLTERPWAGGRVLTHAGSNTMWTCVAWLAPGKDFAVLVAANRGGDAAAKACDEAAGALIRDHASRKDR